ncbi:coiled-coil domain-containing protein 62-like [Dendronephthya gigantea]|uniref:coiled-coil domain-containing protein 62-like n=1 Tax=Dendronephthya gigantea TaxID=151771 RepID=UPI0010697C07|nr:coiled-coil domain-containing protein 62-like [Dendronephthya gigantea]
MEGGKYNGVLSGKSFDISGRKRDQPHSGVTSSYQPTSYYQSTPKVKSSLSSPVSLMNGSMTRSPSSASRSPSSVGRRSASPLQTSSVTPTQLHHGTSTSPRQLLDLDTDTVQKQRRELQLLIVELKDRDKELNDMVQMHQKHLQSWDEDRQRILALERRCARLEGELKSRNEQCKALTARLKSSETDETNKRKELEATVERLKEVTEEAEFATEKLQDLEDKNTNLSDSLRELSNNLGQLQAREQELLTKIKLKENDITEANIRIGEFQQKTRRLENAVQECQTHEKIMKAERDQFRDQLNATKHEVENLRGEMSKQFSDADDLQSELAQSKQEVLVLQKEVFISGEREKRKDQLLELQKSKQERSDSELKHLRQICERQQRDISYMQMHLQTSQESFLKSETKDQERLFDNATINNHPEWLNTSTGNISHDSTHGFPSRQTSPLKDAARDFTNLSLKDLEYDLDGALSYFPETKSHSSTANSDGHSNEQVHRKIGSPELTSESEQYFPLPSFPGVQIFPMTSFADPNLMTNTQNGDVTGQPRDEESSPTSKLHRLLAESRQMVQNLEQSTITTPPTGSAAESSGKLSPTTTSPNTE